MRARFEKIPLDHARSFRIEERQLPRFDAPWHFHPEIELTLIVNGRGRRFVGDSSERFSEGDLVLLGPNLPHFWHSDEHGTRRLRAHSVVVQFPYEFLGPELWCKPEFAEVEKLIRRSARGLQFRGPDARQAAARLRALTTLKGLPALVELLSILEFLAHARRTRPLASSAHVPSLDRRSEQRLARVYDFLMRNFRERLTLAEIARVGSMSPEAFSRYFKRATGRNLSVFLNELRTDYASRQLRETNRLVSDIAVEAGFPTLSSFNRRFRERMHCTPRAYRREHSEVDPPAADFV